MPDATLNWPQVTNEHRFTMESDGKDSIRTHRSFGPSVLRRPGGQPSEDDRCLVGPVLRRRNGGEAPKSNVIPQASKGKVLWSFDVHVLLPKLFLTFDV